MSELTEHEVIMRLSEGLKMAADAASMLGIMQRNSDFGGISLILQEIQRNSLRLATSHAMSKANLDAALKKRERIIAVN